MSSCKTVILFRPDFNRLRGVFSSFWHQINTHRLLVIANLLLYKVLRIPSSWKGSAAERYLRAWLVFLISGMFHIAIDVSAGKWFLNSSLETDPRLETEPYLRYIPRQLLTCILGIPVAESGALNFFLVQPLGIMIEDLVNLALDSIPGRFPLPNAVKRSIGALWVGLWMAWTAPWYLYPILSRGSGDDGVIPVSIISYMRNP